MAKYDPLKLFLRGQRGAAVRVTFAEIDTVVGGLPRSARTYLEWWDNGSIAVHTQARAWAAAGFRVEAVDLEREIVRFVRAGEATNAGRSTDGD